MEGLLTTCTFVKLTTGFQRDKIEKKNNLTGIILSVSLIIIIIKTESDSSWLFF